MKGTIFNIQKFCINDGPGIRTTVFLKGCPLGCIWCHNPESQSAKSEILFYREKCKGCGRCTESGIDDHEFVCFNDAREVCGKEVFVDEIFEQIMQDEIFYKNSDGGVTFSGGEPFFQYDFLLELLKKAKQKNLHTAVETSGFVKRERIAEAAKYIDLFLWDYKETDPKKHKQFTGADNGLILDNLAFLDGMGKKIILRCPIVKGYNSRTEHFEGIAATANKFENILHIEVEPYHALGEVKYAALGKNVNKFTVADDGETKEYIREIQRYTEKKVVLA